jgi:hypothetical protein
MRKSRTCAQVDIDRRMRSGRLARNGTGRGTMSGELQNHNAEEPAEVTEQGALGTQPTNLWRTAYHQAELLFDRFDRRPGPLTPVAVDRAERAIHLVMLSYAITATATAAGIVPPAHEIVAEGPATLAGVSLADLSRNHLPAGALSRNSSSASRGANRDRAIPAMTSTSNYGTG